MATWTYSDWPSQTTTETQLVRLNLFITELSNAVGRETASDGTSVSSNAITQLLDRAMAERVRLEQQIDNAGGGASFIKFRTP